MMLGRAQGHLVLWVHLAECWPSTGSGPGATYLGGEIYHGDDIELTFLMKPSQVQKDCGVDGR